VSTSGPQQYASKLDRLRKRWQAMSAATGSGGATRSGNAAGSGDAERGQLRLQKGTVSNLFRYQPRGQAQRRISLSEFTGVIGLDAVARTVDVEGLATYETVVRYCLARGFLPLVAPELKHITVGGATVGIGIESTCFRYGFVHDGLIEADVLLPGGDLVTVRADNEHADLFHALPNSYGTLGYILRARIALHPAKPFVHLQNRRFGAAAPYLEAMRAATEMSDLDFVEGLFYSAENYLLCLGRMVEAVPRRDDIVRRKVYYRLVERAEDIYLDTFDYIFRYDADWFWNVPEGGVYDLFRRLAPRRWRSSSFYTRFAAWKVRYETRTGRADPNVEPLIQDWEVPWDRAEELIQFCLDHVDLEGRPWAVVPIRTPGQATLYPVEPHALYFNLGSYCPVRRPVGMAPFHYTKIIDRKCFDLGGIKMLYSSTFLDRAEFDAIYHGDAYLALKAKYDPTGAAPTLYQKVAFRTDQP
jgi:FAD/FMN-containing dehydrogenase